MKCKQPYLVPTFTPVVTSYPAFRVGQGDKVLQRKKKKTFTCVSATERHKRRQISNTERNVLTPSVLLGLQCFSDHLQESKMCSCIYSVRSCLVCRLDYSCATGQRNPCLIPKLFGQCVLINPADPHCVCSKVNLIVAEQMVAQSSSDAFSPFVQRHQSDCWLGTETFSSLNFHSLRLFSARSSRLGMPLVLNTQIYFLRKLQLPTVQRTVQQYGRSFNDRYWDASCRCMSGRPLGLCA